MKQAKHVSNAVYVLVRDRIQIETEYARRLDALARACAAPFADEIGTLHDALEVLRAETVAAAKAHCNIADDLRKNVETPARELLARQSGIRKNHHTSLSKLLKSKAVTYNAVHKARDKYIAKCREVNELVNQKPGLPPAELEKVRPKEYPTVNEMCIQIKQRITKAQAESSRLDLLYLTLVHRHNDIQKAFEDDFTVVCRNCEILERERYEFLRAGLWTYANAISTSCVANDEGAENIRVALENCSFTSDCRLFLSSQAIGTSPPPPVSYVNFHTGSSLRPLDALPFDPPPRPTSNAVLRPVNGPAATNPNSTNDEASRRESSQRLTVGIGWNPREPISSLIVPRTSEIAGKMRETSDGLQSSAVSRGDSRSDVGTGSSHGHTPSALQSSTHEFETDDEENANDDDSSSKNSEYFVYDPYDLSDVQDEVCQGKFFDDDALFA
ncbi:hypothetical protein HDU83_000692 [Entophlyctis luteolus]|nr:hypothetical protein HDU83_000692 [Entophlyctis luteolus]